MLEAGFTVLVIGMAIRLGPMFLNGNPLLGGLAQGLRTTAQLLIGIGVVLLAIYALFAQAGFETRSQSHCADGGVDIWLHSKNTEVPVAVVQAAERSS